MAEFRLPENTLVTEVEPSNGGAVRFLETLAENWPAHL